MSDPGLLGQFASAEALREHGILATCCQKDLAIRQTFVGRTEYAM